MHPVQRHQRVSQLPACALLPCRPESKGATEPEPHDVLLALFLLWLYTQALWQEPKQREIFSVA